MPYPCQGHRVKVKVTGVKKKFQGQKFFFNFLCILDIFKQKKIFPIKTQNLDLEKFWIFGSTRIDSDLVGVFDSAIRHVQITLWPSRSVNISYAFRKLV